MHFKSLALIIFTTLFLVSGMEEHSENFQQQMDQMHKNCMQGDTSEHLARVFRGSEAPDDLYKCYLACLFDAMGIIDNENQVHFERLTQITEPQHHEEIEQIAKHCGTKAGKNKCDIVYNTVLCYLDYKPEWKLFLERTLID